MMLHQPKFAFQFNPMAVPRLMIDGVRTAASLSLPLHSAILFNIYIEILVDMEEGEIPREVGQQFLYGCEHRSA